MTVDYQSQSKQFIYKESITEKSDKHYTHTVAILLRTKDRPLMLPRALNSIQKQTFKDWQLVIINDGGDASILEKSLTHFRSIYNERLIVINHPTSLGMSRALNVGIDASSSEFIVVHDDDDSWQGNFLEETVAFMQSPTSHDCGGVITHSIKVLEEIAGNQIIERNKTDFNSLDNPFTRINLFRLLMQNTFPPISFLFRRLVVDKIGYFNEDLPVLNDWDFNIRCGLHYEIGVIHKLLANYHHRINQQNSAYGNSIIATSDLCLQYETAIRNSALRNIVNNKENSPFLDLCLVLGGHYVLGVTDPVKIDYLVKHQQQLQTWIDQSFKGPLGQDLGVLQKQLNNIQDKLDTLLKKEANVSI
jgi:glycosyltransferase involved in cell wall biosynthesis